MLVRQSLSSVSGVGSERPRRLLIPAARITTCGAVVTFRLLSFVRIVDPPMKLNCVTR
jgi:hypothetical protein